MTPMAARGARIWLAQASRFAGLPRRTALIAAGFAVALILACFTALPAPGPPPNAKGSAESAEDRADVILYQNIIEGVRHGGSYYPVAAEALRRGPYPLKPFVTFRLPTLGMIEAWLPDVGSVMLLYALALGTLWAWFVRLGGVFARPAPRLVAVVLLFGGLSSFVQGDLVTFHEVWAGPLIALSLALWRPGKATAAIAIGLCAMLIRETAALYCAVMAGFALYEGRRREVAGWGAAVAVLAVAVACHAWAVAQVVRPLDDASPGWSGMLGFGFFVKVMTLATALSQVPLAVAAPLIGVALIGWAGWRDATGARAFATMIAYALLLAVFCRVDTYYWALLIAPISLVGLAFAPDAIRDLARAALDTRRITVTRTAR